jgi:hypothetical protein
VAVEVAALSELQGNPTGEDDQKLQQQLQARLHRRDREILVYRSVRMMRDLQTHTGKLFEIMVRNVDVVLPGGNGLQIPVLQPDGSTLYAPNHRTSETLTVEEGKSKYHAKLDKFLGQGGELTEMFELTKTSFAELSSGSMVEYVELVDGTVRVTPGDAGHLLLAEGQPVRAAGQLMVLREQSVTEQSESKLAVSEVDPISATTATTVTAMYVSNGSGTYKPDLYAAWRLSDRLANSYQVGAERVIVCKGMPAHCQTYKILLKSMGKTNAQVAEKVSSLLATAAEMCQPAELLLWEKEAARKLTVDRPEKEVAKRLARMQKQAAKAALQQTATTPGLKQSQ